MKLVKLINSWNNKVTFINTINIVSIAATDIGNKSIITCTDGKEYIFYESIDKIIDKIGCDLT
jgi:uncharacterized protein YlzI (FlbEa/FlbD family)